MPSSPSLAHFAVRAFSAAFLALLLACVGVARAQAQTVDCERLQASIASLPRGNAGGAERFQRAAAKQRSEIGRTEAYARSLGCEKSRFSVFGDSPAPQCSTILGQIDRMRGNLAQLERASGGAGGGDTEGRRRQLMARYNANCGEVAAPPQVAAAPQRPRERGFFENIFGGGEPPRQQQALNAPQPDFQQIPLDATQNPAPRATDDGERSYGAHGGNVAVCVRTCDGGFFPVSYSAGRADPEDLALLCSALCPNTPVSVYSYSGASDIETAVSAEGEPYRAMPTAFRYRTTFDPSCSCKAPHQTWVAALAEAERLITSGGGRHDVVVSEQKAEEMSRLKAAPVPVKAAAKGTAKGDPLTTGVPVTGAVATGAVAPDTQGVREATSGATVPTAGQETAGISAGDGTSATTYSREQGQMKDIVLPSGVKRRVRIIGPKL